MPSFERNASQPATAPGTVTVWMPPCGIVGDALAFQQLGVSPAGAQPQLFSPWSVPVFAS